MEKKYCVYKHTNKTNGKVYIGITSNSPEHRWNNGKGYKRSPHFQSAINKYGWDNFEHEILYTDFTKSQACKMERKLISNLDATNPDKGYNMCLGGEGRFGCKLSDEERAKRRASAKAYWSNPENRKAQSEKLKGRPKSDDTKKRMSIAFKGRVISQEQREKLSKSLREYYSKAENRKMQSDLKPKKRAVICLDTITIYPSFRQAWIETGISQGNIYSCCMGKRKHAGGCEWAFIKVAS